MSRTPIAALVALTLSGAALAQPIRIDGQFDDWSGVPVGLTDPSGDALGAFDVTAARAVAAGTVVFVEFDSGSTMNLAAGPTSDLDIFVRFFLPGDGTSVYVRLHSPNLIYVDEASNQLGWAEAGFAAAPTYASDRFELCIDLAAAGAQMGDEVHVSFGPNGTGGPSSDDTASSIVLTLGGDEPGGHQTPLAPDACAAWRIASINVLNNGLTDGSARLASLVDGADADIYCFQEEYGASAGDIAGVLGSIDPHGDGASWNAHIVNDNAIASRRPLVPLPSFNSKYAGAVVVGDSPGTSIAVLSIHPKCCGYIGSSEDTQRINETAGMVQTIEALRTAAGGSDLAPYRDVPVLVAGDWNLVGSRTPLDMLTAPAIPGMARLDLPKPGADDHATWRSLSASSGFYPGQLDLIAYSADRVNVLNAYVLDTAALDALQLAELGVGADDSLDSDHLMLVADVAYPNPADLAEPLGVLDFSDVAAFLSAFVAQSPEADLAEPQGVFDFSDALAFLGAFAGACSGSSAP